MLYVSVFVSGRAKIQDITENMWWNGVQINYRCIKWKYCVN